MKAISLFVSLTVFLVSGYFFAVDFKFTSEINHLIYMSLLVVLMLICIIGILINMPLILKERNRMKILVYNNKYSRRPAKAKKFHIQLETT